MADGGGGRGGPTEARLARAGTGTTRAGATAAIRGAVGLGPSQHGGLKSPAERIDWSIIDIASSAGTGASSTCQHARGGAPAPATACYLHCEGVGAKLGATAACTAVPISISLIPTTAPHTGIAALARSVSLPMRLGVGRRDGGGGPTRISSGAASVILVRWPATTAGEGGAAVAIVVSSASIVASLIGSGAAVGVGGAPVSGTASAAGTRHLVRI